MRILVIEDEPSLNDLIILDVMLPNINGFDILKEIKRNKIKSKIIMLTAKSSLENKLEDLNSRANDYVTKPFHMDELLARVNVLIRPNSLNIISYKDIKLDTTNYNLKCKPHIKSLWRRCNRRKKFRFSLQYHSNRYKQYIKRPINNV